MKNILRSITERDIDLLILEDLHVSDEFREWFVKKCYSELQRIFEFVGAWHSVSHIHLGESDLVIIVRDNKKKRFAILIEDKVKAPPQPRQALRYKERGQAGIEDKEWEEFKTCLVAPQKYIKGSRESGSYDVCIAYESITKWYASQKDSPRYAYRAQVLKMAIDHQKEGYNPELDENVTKFWKSFWECASEESPELAMPEPGEKPSRALWIDFRDVDIGPARRIVNKLNLGWIDLEISRAAGSVKDLKTLNAHLLGNDIKVVKASKSAAFRIIVPKVEPSGDFNEQIKEVRAGLRAAFRLLHMAKLFKYN